MTEIDLHLTGCNQVGVEGRSSPALQPGDLWEGGRLRVGREAGLGDGAEVKHLQANVCLSCIS